MLDVFIDAILDTLKILPILYLVYLLVSYVGHNNNNKYTVLMNKTKKLGPLIGAVTGCVPQCGFSVVMADLYSKKAITMGTLIAVMIATSDEAIPIMIANPNFILPMIIMIAIKLVVAIIFGYLIDLVFVLFKKKQNVDVNAFSKVHAHDCDLTACSKSHIIHCHENKETCNYNAQNKELIKHEHHSCVNNIFLDALLHTIQIAAFLFVATFLIGIIINFAGTENLSKIFTSNKFVSPFIASLVGLIPSCASSVFLVEFYMAGGITFGALLAGLCSGSGIGILVLFAKNRKNWKKNLVILTTLYLIGSLVGIICNLFY